MATPATSATWTGEPDGLDSLFGIIDCDLVCTIGATGAPTIVHGTNLFDITRNSAGNYTIGFKAGPLATAGLVKVVGQVVAPTETGGLDVFLITDNSTSSSTPNLIIKVYARGGTTATEITSGNTLTVSIRIKTF